jgi:N-acetylglutamate synthase-like GNAT family acetyltransferase
VEMKDTGQPQCIQGLEIRRARQGDLAAIPPLIQEATQHRSVVDEAKATEWLLGKGLWIALQEDALVGLVAWQAENLVSVVDVFHVSPDRPWAEVGCRLLKTVEAEASTLMCEVNLVLLPRWASAAARAFLQQQGYESKQLAELHRVWQEVVADYVGDEPELMVKRLRNGMVTLPV